MGKSCVRVKNLDGIPLDVVGDLFKRVRMKDFVAQYEAARDDRTAAKAPARGAGKKPAKKPAKKAAKKASAKPARARRS
jgi:hypothetical protein